MSRDPDPEEWTSRLPLLFPEFKKRYQASIDSNRGELLPYMIWAELARFLAEHRVSADEMMSSPKSSDLLARVSSYLEEASSCDAAEVQNLVQVGFLETVNDLPELRKLLQPRFGRSTNVLLRQVDKYSPPAS